MEFVLDMVTSIFSFSCNVLKWFFLMAFKPRYCIVNDYVSCYQHTRTVSGKRIKFTKCYGIQKQKQRTVTYSLLHSRIYHTHREVRDRGRLDMIIYRWVSSRDNVFRLYAFYEYILNDSYICMYLWKQQAYGILSNLYKPKKSWIDPNLRHCVIARFETSAQLVITRDYETDRSISKLKS